MNRREQIEQLLADARREGYQEAIREGVRTAQSIFLRFSENHKLIKPTSPEELVEWANRKIGELEVKAN